MQPNAIKATPHKVIIYTDGACRGNPGPGGWGALLCFGEYEKTLQGGEPQTTSNRMELQAAIEALRALRYRCQVELYTDSQYLQKGVSEWMDNWKQKNWQTKNRKPVKNRDLWVILDDLRTQHDINWYWVRGHCGDRGNELADQLAKKAIDQTIT